MEKSVCVVQNGIISNRAGGYEIQVYNIFSGLARIGWNVHYVAEGDTFSEFEKDGIQVITLPRRHYFSFYNPALFSAIKNLGFKIIYSRSRTPFSCGLIGMRLARLMNAKYVFSVGSPDDFMRMYLTKSLWQSHKLNYIKKSIVTPDTAIKDYLFEDNFRKADTIITQNNSQKELCVKHFKRQSVIIKSGHSIVSQESIIKDVPISISWIANARPIKQPELFLELASACQDLSEILGVTFHMVMGGNLRSYEGSDLLRKIREQKNIKLYGSLSIEEANDLMARSSLLINTSLYEGFSNTYIQAWIRQTPVVTLHCDPDDVVQIHKIGFHSRTFEKLIKDTRQLILDKNLRHEMGTRARQFAVSEHNIEKIVLQYDTLFSSVI